MTTQPDNPLSKPASFCKPISWIAIAETLDAYKEAGRLFVRLPGSAIEDLLCVKFMPDDIADYVYSFLTRPEVFYERANENNSQEDRIEKNILFCILIACVEGEI